MKKSILNGRFLIVLLAFAMFTLCAVSTFAQPKYGINSITTVTPPYPITLDGYVAEGGTKVLLQILPTDITLSQYPVLLKLVIKGNGITLESKSLTIHEPVYLNGNEFLTLNGSDLEAFFNPDNLNFSGYSKTQYQRNGRLPEGVYTVGFELYDVIRKIPVASVRSTIVFLFLNEVPALTLPMNEQMISAAGTQTVNFRWTTRHSPLAATFFVPEYLFELWEISPAGRNPYDVVKGTRPLYATTLSSPYLAYGVAEPQLQPGKNYAWRVRESDPENRTLFKNNGYTEVYTFTYGRNCPAPELSADKVGTSHLSVNWKADINEKEFELRYREKKKKNAEWYSQSSNLLSGKVDNLKQNTVYEVEVCAVCGDQRSEYSNRLEINTRQNTSFKCGQIDSSRMPQNKNPLRKLSSGDVFNAYGFDVQVKEVTGGGGTYTGKGYVLVPVLNFIKVEVKFDNIQLNEEYQLIGGEVRTVYNLKNTIGSKFEKGGVIDDLTKLITGDEEKNKFDDMADKTIEVDSVKEIKLENGKVVITDVNGKTEEVSTASNKIIAVKTEEGKEYVVDTGTGTIYSSGNSGQKAPVGSSSGPVTTATQAGKGSTPKYSVSFLPHQLQECGFDYPSGKSPAANYEQVEITGKPTLVPWKSTQVGRIERITAEIAGGPADSVRYYRESNNVVMTAPGTKANQQQIMLNGLGKNDEDKLYAWYAAYNQGDTNKTYARVLAGQLNTISYEKKTIKVVLVPVNNSSCPRADYVQAELNRIYKSAIVEWNVLNGDNITITFSGGANAVFDNTDKDETMNYTPDMKAAIDILTNNPQYNKETYYLFFLDNAKDPSVKGYMPLKKQFGFIFKYKQYPDEYLRTIAHELGHGPFRLYHTFSNSNKYPQTQGATDNLMDYADAGATNLNKYQWDWVHDPEWRIYWGEEEKEGADKGNNDFLYLMANELSKIIGEQLGSNDFTIIHRIKCKNAGNFAGSMPIEVNLSANPELPFFTKNEKPKTVKIYFDYINSKESDIVNIILHFKFASNTFLPNLQSFTGNNDENFPAPFLGVGFFKDKKFSIINCLDQLKFVDSYQCIEPKDIETELGKGDNAGFYVVDILTAIDQCLKEKEIDNQEGKIGDKFYSEMVFSVKNETEKKNLRKIADAYNSIGDLLFKLNNKETYKEYGDYLKYDYKHYLESNKKIEDYLVKLQNFILDFENKKDLLSKYQDRENITFLVKLFNDDELTYLPMKLRVKCLNVLASKELRNSLFGKNEEGLVLRLVKYIKDYETNALVDSLKVGKLLNTLDDGFNDLYGDDNYEKFIDIVDSYILSKQKVDESSKIAFLGEAYEKDRFFNLTGDNLKKFISASGTVEEGKLELEVSRIIGYQLVQVAFNDVPVYENQPIFEKYRINSDFDEIIALYHNSYLKGVDVSKQKQVELISALKMHYYVQINRNENIKSNISTAIDLLTFCTGPLGAGVKGLRVIKLCARISSVTSLISNTSDKFIIDNFPNGGADFIHSMQFISAVTGMVDFGATGYLKIKTLTQGEIFSIAKFYAANGKKMKSLEETKQLAAETEKLLEEFDQAVDLEKGLGLSDDLMKIVKAEGLANDVVARVRSFVTNVDDFAKLLTKKQNKLSGAEELVKEILTLQKAASKTDVKSIKSFQTVLDDIENLITKYGKSEGALGQGVIKYLDQMLETEAKFKAGATGLNLLTNTPDYLKDCKLIGLENKIFEQGDDLHRFDLLFSRGESQIKVFVDTKNYTNISDIFAGRNIEQLKSYFKAIDNIDELFIVVQNRSNYGANALLTLKKNLQKVMQTDPTGFYNLKASLFNSLLNADGTDLIKNMEDFKAVINSAEFAKHPISDIIKILE